MAVALDLGKMTTADKLRLMEDLWQNLAAEDLEIPSPSWHDEVLAERERQRLITSGEESYVAWEVAKKQLRAELQREAPSSRQPFLI
jgi:Putative addiction module component